MKLHLFGYGITISGHRYRKGQWHQCGVVGCPVRLPPAEIKFVIARRDIGAYSERFDTREDAERAIRFFRVHGQRFDILESTQVFNGQWIVGDPEIPESAGITFLDFSFIRPKGITK